MKTLIPRKCGWAKHGANPPTRCGKPAVQGVEIGNKIFWLCQDHATQVIGIIEDMRDLG